MSAGYSGTPVATKPGLKPGARVALRHAPGDYLQFVGPAPGLAIDADVRQASDIVHVFVVLAQELAPLRTAVRPDATLWTSWPKKASKRSTDATRDDA